MEHTFKGTDGSEIKVLIKQATGMAGEPIEICYFIHDGKAKNFKAIEHLLANDTYAELCEWISDIEDSNYNNAVNWVI
jgi:hypothetical protein